MGKLSFPKKTLWLLFFLAEQIVLAQQLNKITKYFADPKKFY